jgi:hypothetical protein
MVRRDLSAPILNPMRRGARREIESPQTCEGIAALTRFRSAIRLRSYEGLPSERKEIIGRRCRTKDRPGGLA